MIRALAAVLAATLAPCALAAQDGGAMARQLAACGGTEIRLSGPADASEDDLAAARDVLNRRLGGGFLLRYVAVEEGRLVVRLPASRVDLEAFAPVLSAARLEFYEMAEDQVGLAVEGPDGPLLLRLEPFLTGAELRDAAPTLDMNDQPALILRLSPEGAATFADVTARSLGAPLAVVLDGDVLSVPRVMEPIYGGTVQISGAFTEAEVAEMASLLQSGQLPIDLTIESADEVPADPGADQSLCP